VDPAAPPGAPGGTRLTVRVERIAALGDSLAVDLAVEHLLDPATEAVLERGVPVTLVHEVEVWRERAAWFDRLEAARALVWKLQRDVWDEIYVVRDGDGREETYPDLGEARAALERRSAVAIAPLGLLGDRDSYYLVVNSALKPLTVEDVDELEGWLSGELKSGRQRGFGLLGLPKALFGLVLNLTGIRDRNDTLRTASFRRADVVAGTGGAP
jgi:hypothetical protein